MMYLGLEGASHLVEGRVRPLVLVRAEKWDWTFLWLRGFNCPQHNFPVSCRRLLPLLPAQFFTGKFKMSLPPPGASRQMQPSDTKRINREPSEI